MNLNPLYQWTAKSFLAILAIFQSRGRYRFNSDTYRNRRLKGSYDIYDVHIEIPTVELSTDQACHYLGMKPGEIGHARNHGLIQGRSISRGAKGHHIRHLYRMDGLQRFKKSPELLARFYGPIISGRAAERNPDE